MVRKCLCYSVTYLIFIILFIPQPSFAGEEIYTYKDKDGSIVVTNAPIPEKYQRKAKKIESFSSSEVAPAVIRRYDAEQARIRLRNEAVGTARRSSDTSNKAKKQVERKINSSDPPYLSKMDGAWENYKDEEARRKSSVFSKKPSGSERRARDEYFKAQKEYFDKEFKPDYLETTTITVTSKPKK